jgi:hypothetical protein
MKATGEEMNMTIATADTITTAVSDITDATINIEK